MGDLGRAVLDLTADDSTLYTSISKAEQRARALTATFEQTTSALDKWGVAGGASAKSLSAEVSATSKRYAELGTQGRGVMAELLKGADAATKKHSEYATSLTAVKGAVTQLAGALGLAFSAGAVVQFGRELLRMGDEIQRVADRTGMSTDAVQRLGFVASQSGNSIDDLVSAAGQLQNRLASGDASAAAAVSRLGLSLASLGAQDTYEQILSIGEALGKVTDPAQRTAIAMDLFGKAGAAVLPTLTSDMQKLADMAPVMGAHAVKALDDFGDAVDRFWTGLKTKVAEAVMQGLPSEHQSRVQELAEQFDLTSGKVTQLQLNLQGASKESLDLAESWVTLTEELAKTAPALPTLPGIAPELARIEAQTRALQAQYAREAEQQKKRTQDVANMAREYSGAAARAAAELQYAAVGQAGGIGKMTPEDLGRVSKVLQDYIDHVNARGGQAATHLLDLYGATLKFTEPHQLRLLDGIPGAIAHIGEAAPFAEPRVLSLNEAIEELTKNSNAFFFHKPGRDEAPPAVVQQIDRVHESLRDLSSAFVDLGHTSNGTMAKVASAIGGTLQSGAMGAGAMASIQETIAGMRKIDETTGEAAISMQEGVISLIASIVQMTAAMEEATQSSERWKNVLSGAATGAAMGAPYAEATGGWSLVAGAIGGGVYGAFKDPGPSDFEKLQMQLSEDPYASMDMTPYEKWKIEQLKASKTYHQEEAALEKEFGGLPGLIGAQRQTGVDLSGLIFPKWQEVDSKNLEAFRAKAEELKKAVEAMSAAASKYQVTIDQLSPYRQAEELQKQADALDAERKSLERYGVTGDNITRDMADGLNEYLATALKAKGKLPDSIRPMLEAMTRLGLVTDANKRKLLGLGEAIDVQGMSDLAAKYGIIPEGARPEEIAAIMGPLWAAEHYQQSTQTIAEDWTTLTKGGMDQWRALSPMMSAQVVEAVNAAAKNGFALPQELKPLVEMLVSTGRISQDVFAGLTFGDLADETEQQTEDLLKAFDTLFGHVDALPSAIAAALSGNPLGASAGLPADYTGTGLLPVPPSSPGPNDLPMPPPDAPPSWWQWWSANGGSYHTGGLITAHGGAYLGSGWYSRVPVAHSGLYLQQDERPFVGLLGEGVLNREYGMPIIGGPAGLDALNRGELPSAMNAGDVTLQVQGLVNERVLLDVIVDKVFQRVRQRGGGRRH